ncbi:MAG: hypothetical protein UT05_C0014G0007 [Parcubacteria group bacterium GW2011_GWF2_38_76]|nr:MAG: hypothetical protein UT05_C0014G0007 [Parcubacteria group bacterium GW2011_GWF2_38_76]
MLNKYFRSKFIFAFVVSLTPLLVFADQQTLGQILNCGGNPCKLSDVLKIIEALNSYLAWFLIPSVAVIAFIYAGLKMVMGVGNPGEIGKAKNIMYDTVYGIIIAFAAYFIIDMIVSGLAGGTADEKVTEFLNK